MRYEELSVGQSAEMSKTATEADVVLFGGLVGDMNPVHMDAEAAKSSPFGGRIAHGMWSAGLISAVLGMRLPGPGTIYMQQSLTFRRPVHLGDTVTARVEVTELIAPKRRVRLATACRNQRGEVVLDGEALVMLPDPAAAAGSDTPASRSPGT
jgi:3-hydroxybutyryl-CoA dehydratase